MSTTADGLGTIEITTSAGGKEVAFNFNVVTEEVLEHSRGRLLVVQNASGTVIPKGNIANIAFIWLKVVRESNESTPANLEAVNFTIAGPATTSLPDTHVLLWITNPRTDVDLINLTVDGHADYDVIVEYAIAGRA